MERVDESGFFSVLMPGRQYPEYSYVIEHDNGKKEEILDPYCVVPKMFTKSDLDKFAAGIHYTIYDKLGAHPMLMDDMEGTYFAVWAPNAVRVSVVRSISSRSGSRG